MTKEQQTMTKEQQTMTKEQQTMTKEHHTINCSNKTGKQFCLDIHTSILIDMNDRVVV